MLDKHGNTLTNEQEKQVCEDCKTCTLAHKLLSSETDTNIRKRLSNMGDEASRKSLNFWLVTLRRNDNKKHYTKRRYCKPT